MCEAFFEHLQRRTFPGGCFFASAALEMGTRPGPVKEAVAAFQAGFVDLIRGFAATAIEQNELPAGEDPDRLAFELNGIILATDTNFVLHDDPAVLDLARQVVRRRLGLGGLSPSVARTRVACRVRLPLVIQPFQPIPDDDAKAHPSCLRLGDEVGLRQECLAEGPAGTRRQDARQRNRRPWFRPSRPSAPAPSGRSSTGSCAR